GSARLGHAAARHGSAVEVSLDSQERPDARHGSAVGAGVPRDRADQASPGAYREDPGVQGDEAVLRQGRARRALRPRPFTLWRVAGPGTNRPGRRRLGTLRRHTTKSASIPRLTCW